MGNGDIRLAGVQQDDLHQDEERKKGMHYHLHLQGGVGPEVGRLEIFQLFWVTFERRPQGATKRSGRLLPGSSVLYQSPWLCRCPWSRLLSGLGASATNAPDGPHEQGDGVCVHRVDIPTGRQLVEVRRPGPEERLPDDREDHAVHRGHPHQSQGTLHATGNSRRAAEEGGQQIRVCAMAAGEVWVLWQGDEAAGEAASGQAERRDVCEPVER
mmetsp:Transcript_35212/g.79515  ORF Transcript_35212/g.79515 Transcript_35212/m.79515 type:complete len:213 (-) Transcript_35212:47-685(-)